MTTGERKALAFLAGVAVIGGAARVVTAPAHTPTVDERLALATQISAVDSARERARGGGAKRARPPRAPRAGRVSTPASSASSEKSAPSEPVDVDVADSTALEALPGVGPALAARIVADRAAHGGFGSLAGLQQVRGVGPKLAERLAPHVTFSSAPRPSAPSHGRPGRP